MHHHRFYIFLAAILTICRPCAGGVQYSITNLGTLGGTGFTFSQANAINASGQVAGTATINGTPHAFFYDGQMHNLGSIVTNGSSSGLGLNDQGVVVGQSDTTNASDAFYISATTQGSFMVDMGTLPNGSGNGSSAFAVNNSGVIVGVSYHGNGLSANAFSYSGSMHDLGDLENSGNGAYYSGATAINPGGVIVGEGQTTAAVYQAFVYSGTIMTALPFLPGDSGSDAYGINSSGMIVGESGNNDGQGEPHAVYWVGTNVVAIGSLSTNQAGVAYGVNNVGQIVGYAETAAGAIHAFVWTNGVMSDLNDLIAPGKSGGFAYLYQAKSINKSGVIVGYGYTNANLGNSFAFLATPTSGSAANPSISLDTPLSINQQIQLNFSVANLTNPTFHLLQINQLNTAWATNSAAVLTTNTLNNSYRFTVTNNAAIRFYRIQTP